MTKVFIALLVLLALSVAVSVSGLPSAEFVSFGIAVVKAGLILFFFMRLRESSGGIRLAAFLSLLWLFFFFVLVGADYGTRGLWGVLGK